MQLKRYISSLIFIFIILFVFSIVMTNIFIRSSMEDSGTRKKRKENVVSERNQSAKRSPQKMGCRGTACRAPTLITENPSQYNIQVSSDSGLSLTQMQWDRNMNNALVHSKGLEHMEEHKAFEGIKKTPEEFKRRMKRINKQIKQYEKITRRSPGDQDAELKLQTLYMLKSTLTVLKDNIVEKSPKR